ncbi:MAG: PilZ domain-containing protein [Thermodesulfobacteriota bacterium]
MNTEQEPRQGMRKRSRVNINLSVVVGCGNNEIRTQTKNISLKGLLCFPHPSLQEEELCNVVIWLSEQVKIEVQGKVVRTTKDGTAIDFSKMSIESFSHLYNLVRLNCKDPDKLDKEFQYPAFVEQDR